MTNEKTTNGAASVLSAGLASALPWHVGFHNEIADMLRSSGDWHPDIVRYSVVQVCDREGRHVCWAKSPEHAALIVEAVNLMANVLADRREPIGEASSPKGDGRAAG